MFSSNASQVSNDANYIEQVFATHLYTGAGLTQTINNGIDLAGKGGLVWLKDRGNTGSHRLVDTVRGNRSTLFSDSTSAAVTRGDDVSCDVSSFNSNGFTAGNFMNQASNTYASWTFRKQPKFFDVVTFTTSGTTNTNQRISHSLGSAPGMIILKGTNAVTGWPVYHKDLNGGGAGAISAYLLLNDTAASGSYSNVFGTAVPTSTDFGINTNFFSTNTAYVAYVLASDAGGFGLTGTDNVISCGSFTGPASSTFLDVNLGYEPQWILWRRSDAADDWKIFDTMRGMTVGGTVNRLFPNNSDAEQTVTNYIWPSATGLRIDGNGFGGAGTYIYITIRRGPMKTPTSGTQVYGAYAKGSGETVNSINLSFSPDLMFAKNRSGGTASGAYFFDRLRGSTEFLISSSTAAGATAVPGKQFVPGMLDATVGAGAGSNLEYNDSTNTSIFNFFRRAPGFFDEVCYTGTGSVATQAHNLGVAPEMIIVKSRSAAYDWPVYHAALPVTNSIFLNSTSAAGAFAAYFNNTAPTSTVFSLGGGGLISNASGVTYVAYLFASCPGVQYINSYVGDGTTGRTINCGFTGGARFVCIKATSTTGSWWTFDSARGITTNADPVLQLNSTAAEITSADAIDPAASGFIVNQEATCSLNASGVSYLVWAIA